MGGVDDRVEPAFDVFVKTHEPRLRVALVLAYGPDIGREATAEALAYAWERWPATAELEFPVPYLFRVGQSRTRRLRRAWSRATFPEEPTTTQPWIEPQLSAALNRLTSPQRVCTVLVHCFEWHLAEVAELLGINKSTVQTHVERGMQKLRDELRVDVDG